MANKRSESEKKPNGDWNLSACTRKVLRELGPDVPIEVLETELKSRYKGLKEAPTNLYTLRAEMRKEMGIVKPAGKGKGGRKPGRKPGVKVAVDSPVTASPSVSANGHTTTDSSVVRAVTLTQEAMGLCGGRQGLLELIDRLTVVTQ